MNLRRALIVASLAIAVSGCGTQQAGQESLTPASPTEPDGLLLSISYEGGYTAPGADLSSLPFISVYNDGRVFTLGPQIAIYPGPALPNVQVGTISEKERQALVDQAVQAGVTEKNVDYGQPPVADASNTVITLNTSEGTFTQNVYALQEASPGIGLTEEQAERRQRLQDFVTQTQSVGQTDTGSYEFDRLAVFIQSYAEMGDRSISPEERRWNGPTLTVDAVNDTSSQPGAVRMSCLLLSGPDLDTVMPDIQQANTLTRWTQNGEAFALQFRPLLPDETSCDEAASN